MRHVSKVVPALLALVAAVGLASCGGDGGGSGYGGDDTDVVSGQFERVVGAPSGYAAVAGEATIERADGRTTVSLDLRGLAPDGEYVAHLHSGGCDRADPGGPHFKFDPKGSDEPPNEIHLAFSANGQGAGTAKASSDREVPSGAAGSVVVHEAGGEDEAGEHGGSEHSSAGHSADGETVLVHEGHQHEDEPAPPAKIACAQLEGGGGASAPGDNPESASMGGQVPTVVVRDGEPVGGIEELEYDAGEQIRFEVNSDVADEVHVHGYDLSEDVTAGGTVSFDFPAEIEGIFEIELETRGTQIAELRVNP